MLEELSWGFITLEVTGPMMSPQGGTSQRSLVLVLDKYRGLCQ